jgi:hypothetical protein
MTVSYGPDGLPLRAPARRKRSAVRSRSVTTESTRCLLNSEFMSLRTRPAAPFTSATGRVNSAAATIAPEARIVGEVRWREMRIAWWLSSCRRGFSP